MRFGRTGSIEQSRGWQRSSIAIGAFAAGAFAIGAYAIGAFAIGRLAIRKARIGDLEIGALSVREMRGGRSFQHYGGHKGNLRSDVAATTARVADEYVALCRRGEFDAAMSQCFSADHVHLESPDMIRSPTEVRGIEAIQESSRGFSEKYEIHGFDVEGPFVGGRQFAVRFSIDASFKRTGGHSTIRKLDLYTVQNGTIVRSEVYYNTPPLTKS